MSTGIKEPRAAVKTDCIQYRPGKKDCKALNKLYCETECRCSFYKPEAEYERDGRMKKRR